MKSHSDYVRSPNAPKIKGIYYEFLREAVKMSKERFLSVRLYRKFDFIKERRIKHFLRQGMKLWKAIQNTNTRAKVD